MLKTKHYLTTISIVLLSFLMATGCDLLDVDEVIDPNNPSSAGVLNDATRGELQNMVTGLESRHRGYVANTTQLFGSFGRETWNFFASDPRFTIDWLGQETITEPYPNFFSSGGTYNTPYQAIKQANLLIEAVENTTTVTDAEANAYLGLAKTIKAFQYLIPLNGQYQNGIRIDVAEPLNPGPFLSYDAALDRILSLLDEAYSDLNSAPAELPFSLTEGFGEFATTDGLKQVNRAIKARASIYAEDFPGALNALNDSFMELAAGEASMNRGVSHVYGNPPDSFNPLFYPLDANTNQIMVVHPSMIEDAEPGDLRVENKFFERTNPVSNANVPEDAEYQDARFESNTSPIPYLRNEELILIYAEALAQRGQGTDFVDATAAINLIRGTWDLPPVALATSEEIIDQVLFERRYSLWAEGGHRWIDARRYDRLDEIPNRYGRVFTQLARPTSETNWENQNN
jgi:hypothetical protein